MLEKKKSTWMDEEDLLLFDASQFSERMLQKIRETRNLQAALRTTLDERVRPRFLDILRRTCDPVAPCGLCEELLDLLIVALLKKHAWNRLNSNWLFPKQMEELAEQVAYEMLPVLRRKLPEFLVHYEGSASSPLHAYNAFARYCQTVAERRTNRECAKVTGSLKLLAAALKGDPLKTICDRLECPSSMGSFDLAEVKADLSRWANSLDCPVSRKAWRKFLCHQVMGMTAARVAETFNTTEGAIYTNTSRVLKHLEQAGFRIRDEVDEISEEI